MRATHRRCCCEPQAGSRHWREGSGGGAAETVLFGNRGENGQGEVTSEMVDTRPVRASEQLEWSRLEDFLRRALPEIGSAPMEVEQFPGGHSNLTYLLRFGDRELVLRRPPFGPVPPRAHDMAREYRFLQAVHPVFPLAPRPYLLVDDLSIAGFVFYVMERRRGIVIREQEPPELKAHRREISEAMVDTLADLHAIDVAKHGLDALGKPAG